MSCSKIKIDEWRIVRVESSAAAALVRHENYIVCKVILYDFPNCSDIDQTVTFASLRKILCQSVFGATAI